MIWLLPALIVYGTLQSQNIKVAGTVKDELSKQALPNATVTLTSMLNPGYASTLATNEHGSYSLTVPAEGLYKINVSYLGYKTVLLDSVLINAGRQELPPVYLVLEQASIKGVTVVARKPFIVVAPNLVTLNVSQSPIASGGSVYDAIKMAPGITEQDGSLSFRGKAVNILINGRPSHLSGEDLKNRLDGMSAGSIEKIEILPNPPARYDAQGGSVINIVLAKNKDYGTNYILTAGGGTGKYAKENTGIDINKRTSKLNLSAGYDFNRGTQYYQSTSVRYLPGALLKADEYEERRRNNDGYKLAVDYDISSKTSVGFLFNGYINARDRDVVNTSILHYDANVTDSSQKVFTAGNARISSPSLNLYYKTALDSIGKTLTLNADFMNYAKRWSDNFTNRYYDAGGGEYLVPYYLKDNSPGRIKVYSLSADYEMPAKNGKWEGGLKGGYIITDNDVLWENNTGSGWKTDPGKTDHFIYKENVNAAYISYSRPVNKWSLQGGLRTEQTNTEGKSITTGEVNRNSYIHLFPTVNISYTTAKGNALGLVYRKSIVRFGFDYVNPFITYQNAYAYSQGNPHLQPQITHQLSATWSLGQSFLAGFDYIKSIKSLGVSYRSENDVTISSYDNFNGSQVYYLYVSYYKQLLSVWQLSFMQAFGYFSYDVNTTGYNTAGKNNNPFTSINFRNTLSFKTGWTGELNASYVSALVSGIFKRKPYYSADMGVSKNLLKNKLTLKLSCTDVFNTLTADMKVNYQGVVMDKNKKEESRFLTLTARYRFGNLGIKKNKNRASGIEDIRGRIN